jgi:hypothetical protein
VKKSSIELWVTSYMTTRMFNSFMVKNIKRRETSLVHLLPAVTVIAFCTFCFLRLIGASRKPRLELTLKKKLFFVMPISNDKNKPSKNKRIQKNREKKSCLCGGVTHRNRSCMACSHHRSYTSPEFCRCRFSN